MPAEPLKGIFFYRLCLNICFAFGENDNRNIFFFVAARESQVATRLTWTPAAVVAVKHNSDPNVALLSNVPQGTSTSILPVFYQYFTCSVAGAWTTEHSNIRTSTRTLVVPIFYTRYQVPRIGYEYSSTSNSTSAHIDSYLLLQLWVFFFQSVSQGWSELDKALDKGRKKDKKGHLPADGTISYIFLFPRVLFVFSSWRFVRIFISGII